MDGLSGVASGMAVVSLSLQLIQSIGTIKNFVRDVKNASKELQRLIESLDRLNALLHDVRDIMERQTSLRDQQFPIPSMTIFSCLKSCEASLQPLHNLVEKYSKVPDGSSRLLRVKEDIKFGFITKDIAGIEVRIQRESSCLQEAIGLNNTNIMITVLPLLLQGQQSHSVTCSQTSLITQISNITATHQYTELHTLADRPRVSRKKYRIPSILENFGITQYKSISYFRRDQQHSYGTSEKLQDPVSESREFLIWWRIFGYGRRWEVQYPYGSILPSLSVHPIVEEFDIDVRILMNCGSIQNIQRYFATGKLHPFARDIHGQSLLHLAAKNLRPELCRLLIDYGVRASDGNQYHSPMMSCANTVSQLPAKHQINVIRILLPHENFTLHHADTFCQSIAINYGRNKQLIGWVWENATTFCCEEEAMLWRRKILLVAIERLGSRFLGGSENIVDFLCKSMDEDLLMQYKKGSLRLLPTLFSCTYLPSQSIHVGEYFIALLTFWGCDVEACIQMELEALEDGCLMAELFWQPIPRKVVFTGDRHQGWSLGWGWAYDFQDIGYELVSEYSALAGDTVDWGWGWPFPDRTCVFTPEQRMRRFNRRMAAKARKEQARLGQKKTRSRMPGAWI